MSLASVGDYVAAPLDTLVSVLAEVGARPLEPPEVHAVAVEAGGLLRRLREAVLSARHPRGAQVLCLAVREAMTADGPAVLAALSVEGCVAVRPLCDVAPALLCGELGADAATEYLMLLQAVLDAAPLKPALVDVVPRLQRLLGDAAAPNAHRRLAATALINAVKGSSAMKELHRDLGFVGAALLDTDDFYLQLQCTELLFRIARRSPQCLATARLPEFLASSIAVLPTDAQLIAAMTKLLDAHNASLPDPRIVPFLATGVAMGAHAVCAEAPLYFSRTALLVMLPQPPGFHIAIPYATLRSVKVTRDCRLALRLAEAPTVLAELFAAGEETLLLQLTDASLRQLRATPVQGWMAAHIASSPQKRPRDDPPAACPGPSGGLAEVREAMVAGLNDMRQGSTARLREALAAIQEKVDAVQEANRADQAAYEEAVREELSVLQAREQQVRKLACDVVAELNAGLHEMQSVADGARRRTDAAERTLVAALEAARRREADDLTALKADVDGEVQGMEQRLRAAVEQVDPLQVVRAAQGRS